GAAIRTATRGDEQPEARGQGAEHAVQQPAHASCHGRSSQGQRPPRGGRDGRRGSHQDVLVQLPTMVAPRKLSTCPIGFAIADCELPANSRPTARGFVATSSTMSEPESPLFRNREPLFLITIWPVNVFTNELPPAHSFSYWMLTVAFKPVMELRLSPVVRADFFTGWPTDAVTVEGLRRATLR